MLTRLSHHVSLSHSAASKVGRVIPNAPVGLRASNHSRIPLSLRPLTRRPHPLTTFFFALSALTAFLAFATLAPAQTIRWEPATGSLAHNQTSELTLVFENCEPTSAPAIPSVPGLTLQRGGQMQNTTIINGRRSETITIAYAVRPSLKQPVTIPAFAVETDKGRINVAPASFDVSEARIGGTVSLESIVTARFQTPREVWAGEVFPLTYSLSAVRRYLHEIGRLEWTPTPLFTEDWGKPEQANAVVNGETNIVISQATRATARTPGTITLNAGNQLVNVIKGTDMWGRANLDQFSITSDRPTVTVKPLPAGAPTVFNGAVGKFILESKVVPANASVGDPITWTLTLAGTGNWPDLPGLPAREASKDFRVIQPQAKRTNKEGTLFEATLTEDVVLIPTKPGTYTLGPVTFAYFDPAKGEYQTVTAPRTTITIAAPPTPAAGTAPSPRTTPSTTAASLDPQSTTHPSRSTPPSAPAAIPRDPLPGSADAPLPLTQRTLLLAALTPLIPLLVFWFILALRRAKKTDPLRPQREARARLAATLGQLRTAKDRAPIVALLQAWQRDTAALWPLTRAVPSATDLSDGGATPPSRITTAHHNTPIPTPDATSPGSAGGTPASTPSAASLSQPSTLNPQLPSSPWPTLWLDAERCLYRADTLLPADWTARAEAALAARPVKSFSAFSIFLPRNLLPFAAALVLTLTLLAPSTHAQSSASTAAQPSSTIQQPPSTTYASSGSAAAKAAYDRSDFPTAEKSWREQLAKTPTDWIARYNLSLALAQQNRWQESAAHAVTAFVQQPGDASVRWQLALTLEKAGYTPTTISAFITPSPAHSFAREFSPAVWQRLLIAATATLAVALALVLLRIYGARSRLLKPAAWTLATLALLAVSGSLYSLHLYSPTHDTRAALVWKQSTLRSIPTEADTAQKTTPLSAGSIALVNKDYLGWSRLAFPNGQTGWIRTEELRPLWR